MKAQSKLAAVSRGLYAEPSRDRNLEDKRAIEALVTRLNGMLARDPALPRKAALILEAWLNETNRKK
jgi:hypothetical protein